MLQSVLVMSQVTISVSNDTKSQSVLVMSRVTVSVSNVTVSVSNVTIYSQC